MAVNKVGHANGSDWDNSLKITMRRALQTLHSRTPRSFLSVNSSSLFETKSSGSSNRAIILLPIVLKVFKD